MRVTRFDETTALEFWRAYLHAYPTILYPAGAARLRGPGILYPGPGTAPPPLLQLRPSSPPPAALRRWWPRATLPAGPFTSLRRKRMRRLPMAPMARRLAARRRLAAAAAAAAASRAGVRQQTAAAAAAAARAAKTAQQQQAAAA